MSSLYQCTGSFRTARTLALLVIGGDIVQALVGTTILFKPPQALFSSSKNLI